MQSYIKVYFISFNYYFYKLSWRKEKHYAFFSRFPSLGLLICCCTLYVGSYLEKPPNIAKRSLSKQKETLFFILGIFKRYNFIFILRRAASKNGCTFCLDNRLSCYIVFEIFVSPGAFFNNFNLKIGQSRFLLQVFVEFRLMLDTFKILIPSKV